MNQEQEVVMEKKKKWYKRFWFYVAIALLLLAASVVYAQVRRSSQAIEYETVMAEKGMLTQTVDATGNVESADEIDLRFETGGRVGKIYKQINDQARAGEVIVELDLSEINARIAQARASVSRAYANLNKEIAGVTAEQINNLQSKLDQAEANLARIKAQYDSQIKSAEAQVDTAAVNLKLSEGKENSLIVQDAYDDMVATLQTVQTTLAEALMEADNILGIDNTYADDDFEDIISVLDFSKIKEANRKYVLTKQSKQEVDEAVNLLSTASTNDQVDNAVMEAEEALVMMKDLLYSVSEVLENSIPVGGLSLTELNAMKNDIQTARGNISGKYASLINDDQAIESAKNSYTTNKIVYDEAVSTLNNLRLQAAAYEDSYQALVDQARSNLKDAKNPPREVDLAGYRAALWESRASLNQMIANREKSIVRSPVDGVIGKINTKEGESVFSQDVVVKIISPHFEVKVDIPETDIVKISLQDEAEITLDAFSDDVVFKGLVTEIEKGETIIQDVVYYTVTVSIEEGDDGYEILNGMTANIVFHTESKEDVLFIPRRGIHTDDQGKYVRVLQNGQVKEARVQTGLRGDGGMVEVTDGLAGGEEIVIKQVEE